MVCFQNIHVKKKQSDLFFSLQTSTNDNIVGVILETYEIGCVAPLEKSKPGTVISNLTNCPKGNKRNLNNQC